MSARPREMSALFIADPYEQRLALGRVAGEAIVPAQSLERGDGRFKPDERISKQRLGATETRAPAFMDAALRAGFEDLGMLISRPSMGAPIQPPGDGLWGRLARHRLDPDRAALTYLGRALSPIDAESRFHVRVFAAPLKAVTNSLKLRGSVDRTVWLTAETAAEALSETPYAPFPERVLAGLGGQPQPIFVSYRAGQRQIARL